MKTFKLTILATAMAATSVCHAQTLPAINASQPNYNYPKTVEWGISQPDLNAAIQSDQNAWTQAQNAGQSHLNSQELAGRGDAQSAVSGGTASASASLTPAIQTDQAQANYWSSRIWVPYSYTYDCGTKDKPATCTGYSEYYDANAAAQAAYWRDQAARDASTQSSMNADAAATGAQGLQSKDQANLAQQQSNDQLNDAGSYAATSSAQTAAANSGAKAAADAIAGHNASVQLAAIDAATKGALTRGDAVIQPAPITPPDLSADQLMSSGQGAQSIQDGYAHQNYAATQQAGEDYVAQQKAQNAANAARAKAAQYQANADSATTAASRAAWLAAAANAQATADQQQALADKYKAANQADQQKQNATAAAGVAQAPVTAAVYNDAANVAGTAAGKNVLQQIESATGVYMQQAH